MASIASLITKLSLAHPDLTFQPAEHFLWSPASRTIFYDESDPAASQLLFHELGHAVRNHQDYSRDIELVAMETEAWHQAHALAKAHDSTIEEDTIQDHLDTYRDWLHARSLCPDCQATGIQRTRDRYGCLACSNEWRVNEARDCQLRRYSLNPAH